MAAELPSYVTLDEAARRYRISRETLTQMIESGKIRAVKVDGRVAVAECDVLAVSEPDPELRGRPIRVSKAAEKYNIPHGTLVRWARGGLVHVIREGPKLLELDEGSVKRAVEVYRAAQKETGSPFSAGHALKKMVPAR